MLLPEFRLNGINVGDKIRATFMQLRVLFSTEGTLLDDCEVVYSPQHP